MSKGKVLGLDRDGIQLRLRKKDYIADMSGQLGLALVGNLVSQLTYFYTDKVGVAALGVGIVLAIAKVIDALTDIIFGNVVEQSKGGNEKYYLWMKRMMIPLGITVVLLFTVPKNMGDIGALIYVLITNVLLTAVFYTLISTPYAATMVVRTESQVERSNMGIFRAIGSYIAGMIMAIALIPITNLLGGNQNAWIKVGVIIGLVIVLTLLICYRNGIKAIEKLQNIQVQKEEEEKVPLKEAFNMLIHSKYWVIVLLFNIITGVTNAISGTANAYYCKWIFGNDNLVAMLGGFGLIGTILGFALSSPMINRCGVRGAIQYGLIGTAGLMTIRCIAPANIPLFTITGVLSSMMQMPLMCLYGVLLGMAVDYNEYKYNKKLLAVSSGAVGFGAKVGGGIGAVVLSIFLALGAYDATLSEATTSMRYAIYGYANVMPIVINLLMAFIMHQFDLEEKLPAMKKEMEERNHAS